LHGLLDFELENNELIGFLAGNFLIFLVHARKYRNLAIQRGVGMITKRSKYGTVAKPI
jgi:hypothetical protein